MVGISPSPLIKGGGGMTFQKLCHLGGSKYFARKGGDEPEKRGGWCGNKGLPLFLDLQSFELAMQDSHPSLY